MYTPSLSFSSMRSSAILSNFLSRMQSRDRGLRMSDSVLSSDRGVSLPEIILYRFAELMISRPYVFSSI